MCACVCFNRTGCCIVGQVAILFSARAEAPVATDAVLHSNKSSLITVSNVCICLFVFLCVNYCVHLFFVHLFR